MQALNYMTYAYESEARTFFTQCDHIIWSQNEGPRSGFLGLRSLPIHALRHGRAAGVPADPGQQNRSWSSKTWSPTACGSQVQCSVGGNVARWGT